MSSKPRKRSLSVSAGNRDSTSRYNSRCFVSSQTKSALENSPPTRVFIKPRSEEAYNNNANDRLARRASFMAAPTNPKRSFRQGSPPPPTVRSRSNSLHHTSNNQSSEHGSKIPRSSTVVRHASTKLVSIASCVVDGDAGFLVHSSTTGMRDKSDADARKATKPAKNKENEPIPRGPAPQGIRRKSKRVSPRKQSRLAQDDLRPTQLSPRRTFLLPKVEEHDQKPECEVRRPRRSTVHSAAPRLERGEKIVKKKASLPTLPTMVVLHTPTSKRSARKLPSCQRNLPDVPPMPVSRPNTRPFLLPQESSVLPSSSSLSSILSLPSQVLKHTPLGSQYSGPASGSPCLSKARTKTIWTMLDEMKLIRSGGLLADGESLAPESSARVIPLCKRLQNVIVDDPKRRVSISGRATPPARSSSMSYHLLVPSARRSSIQATSALPAVLSISRVIARARAHSEPESPKNLKKKATKTTTTAGNDDEKESNNWTLVNTKKQLQRRSTVTADAYTGVGSNSNPNSNSTTTSTGSYAGYDVCIRTYDATPSQRPKASLLTRAHTLMKFKFSGSKRVVGRGDPNWV